MASDNRGTGAGCFDAGISTASGAVVEFTPAPKLNEQQGMAMRISRSATVAELNLDYIPYQTMQQMLRWQWRWQRSFRFDLEVWIRCNT